MKVLCCGCAKLKDADSVDVFEIADTLGLFKKVYVCSDCRETKGIPVAFVGRSIKWSDGSMTYVDL